MGQNARFRWNALLPLPARWVFFVSSMVHPPPSKKKIKYWLDLCYIYPHLVDFYGKCRYIYRTWILWVLEDDGRRSFPFGKAFFQDPAVKFRDVPIILASIVHLSPSCTIHPLSIIYVSIIYVSIIYVSIIYHPSSIFHPASMFPFHFIIHDPLHPLCTSHHPP